MVQRPWELPGVAILLRGGQGVGKTTVVDIIGYLLGKHYLSLAGGDRLTSKFNGMFAAKLLVSGEEVAWGGDRSKAGILKALITNPHELIELKGREPISLRNFKRIIILSNEEWACPRDTDDRRFLVLDTADKFKRDTKFFSELWTQMESGGYEALLRELLAEDISSFNVRDVPNEDTGSDLKIMSGDTALQWIHALLENGLRPDGDFGEWDMSTIETEKTKVFDRYCEWCRSRNLRPVHEGVIAKRLVELTGVQSHRLRENGSRIRKFYFPSLDVARSNFSKIVRGVKWTD
jgi:hypothetical protein